MHDRQGQTVPVMSKTRSRPMTWPVGEHPDLYALINATEAMLSLSESNEIKSNKRCFTVVSACELCIVCWKPIAVCKIQCKSPSRRPHSLITLDNSTDCFCMSHKYFKDTKGGANKQDFLFELNLTSQARSTPQTTRIFSKVFCNCGSNLVSLAWMGDELWWR